MITNGGILVNRISRWIDASYPRGFSPEAVEWRRISKITEEAGEVVEAFYGVLGENPRKGVTHTDADVDYELLDTAAAALGAWAHRHSNKDDAMGALENHLTQVAKRNGLI